MDVMGHGLGFQVKFHFIWSLNGPLYPETIFVWMGLKENRCQRGNKGWATGKEKTNADQNWLRLCVAGFGFHSLGEFRARWDLPSAHRAIARYARWPVEPWVQRVPVIKGRPQVHPGLDWSLSHQAIARYAQWPTNIRCVFIFYHILLFFKQDVSMCKILFV